MALVNAFVAEVASDFKNALKTADDQLFEIQLRSNAQIQVHIQRVMMRDKRFGIGAAHNRMQHRRFDFQKVVSFKITADGRGDFTTLFVDFTAFVVHDKINVTLTITSLNVRQAVEFFRQRLQRF